MAEPTAAAEAPTPETDLTTTAETMPESSSAPESPEKVARRRASVAATGSRVSNATDMRKAIAFARKVDEQREAEKQYEDARNVRKHTHRARRSADAVSVQSMCALPTRSNMQVRARADKEGQCKQAS